jgi:hypothetical protein
VSRDVVSSSTSYPAMSEHWKSTVSGVLTFFSTHIRATADIWRRQPKYWCKHCSTYVKDTKFERAQHEATGKHQGNLRRFLKGLQDGQERSEREKERAKAEVDRLNRVVGGSSASPSTHNVATADKSSSLPGTPQPSEAERKKQLAQLAEMGIAVPDEFRAEMAMAGDWKVVSQKPLEDTTSEDPLSIGVHKRKYDGQEEEEEAGGVVARHGWGSTSRRYPGAGDGGAPNLDALLSGVGSVKKEEIASGLEQEETEDKSTLLSAIHEKIQIKNEPEPSTAIRTPTVKKEESPDSSEPVTASLHSMSPADEVVGAGVVFKKRKPKSTRAT